MSSFVNTLREAKSLNSAFVRVLLLNPSTPQIKTRVVPGVSRQTLPHASIHYHYWSNSQSSSQMSAPQTWAHKHSNNQRFPPKSSEKLKLWNKNCSSLTADMFLIDMDPHHQDEGYTAEQGPTLPQKTLGPTSLQASSRFEQRFYETASQDEILTKQSGRQSNVFLSRQFL